MSIYSTRYITRDHARAKIAERLAPDGPVLATNTQLDECFKFIAEYVDSDDDMTRREKVDVIRDVIDCGGLDRLPSDNAETKLDEILGDIMDVLYKDETLNNYCVWLEGKEPA